MADHPVQAPTHLPKLALVGAIVAFLLALGNLISALRQPFLLISAVVPVVAGVTILRKRTWGAYGLACFYLAQLLIVPLDLARGSAMSQVQMSLIALLQLAIVALFFFAGNALAAIGARHGRVVPWIALSVLFALPFCFLNFFVNASGGMEDTLLPGDQIAVRTFPAITPRRGDILVFRYPVDRRQAYIKRVIGIPGDRIRITSRVLYRNGAVLAEPYAVHKFAFADPFADNFPVDITSPQAQAELRWLPNGRDILQNRDILQSHFLNGEVVVPPNKYFVLGDNRESSLDSRYWGFLDSADVIGKALFIYDSEIPNDGINKPVAMTSRKRWNRIFKLL